MCSDFIGLFSMFLWRSEAFNKLRDVSDKLDEMERSCADEQIEIQRKWDQKKKQHFDERREIIKQVI